VSAPVTIQAEDLLDRAADRIRPPESWTRGAGARNDAGEACDIMADEACRWCATGALWRECWDACEGSGKVGIERERQAERLYQGVREFLLSGCGSNSLAVLVELNDSEGHARAVGGLEYRALLARGLTLELH